MSSFTRRCQWALAFSSISLAAPAVAQAPASDTTHTPHELKLIELEGSLAKDPKVYLAFDPAKRRLDVRLRGIVLERVALLQVELLVFAPIFGTAETPPLLAPAIWRIEQGPGDTDREVIAPPALRPFPTNEEEEAAEAAQSASKPQEKPSEKPSSYRVRLDNGWQLYVLNQPPEGGFLRRYRQAVADGWLRLRGLEPAHPPLLALVLTVEDARRLHHLFRAGMPILVGDGLSEIR